QVSRRLETLLSTADRGRIYREGIALAIVGRPNVGKSSLLNALLRQSRAIVTPSPGTTRDTIEETININGIPVVAIDTAGLRETEDAIELVGVKKAEETIERAGVVLLVLDAQEVITGEDVELRRKFTGKPALVVLNKVDLLTEAELKRCLESASNSFGSDAIMAVSALTGYGIEALEDRIAEVLLGGAVSSTDSVLVSNVRHKRAMESALAGLRHAGQTVDDRQPVDLVSIDLMAARNSLGEITGETAAEDLIDRIFSEFCIGK
ncbi:MAG: GTP-binding protein, partial [Armatimonadota bacterium]|nr:GTP-binding protein [Armatimonadota bacterium]